MEESPVLELTLQLEVALTSSAQTNPVLVKGAGGESGPRDMRPSELDRLLGMAIGT